jgi:hypothetical protein
MAIPAKFANVHPQGAECFVSTLAEVARVIDDGAAGAGIGGALIVTDTPPGSGKSHRVRLQIAGRPAALLTPTVALALQHHEATGGELHASPKHAIPGRDVCRQPDEVAFRHSLGLSAAGVCAHCPHRVGCTARKTVGDPDKGVFATHEHATKFAKDDRILVVDEMPNTTLDVFDLPKGGLVEAIARVVDPPAPALLAWAQEVEAARVGQDNPLRFIASLDAPAIRHYTKTTVDVAEADVAGGTTTGSYFAFPGAKTYRSDVAIALGVWKAARADAVFRDRGGRWEVARLADVLWGLQERGGHLMASGAPGDVLRALRPDVEIRRVDHVDDGRPIKRIMTYTADTATRAMKGAAGKRRTERIVRDAQEQARNFGARPHEMVFFVAKAIAGDVRRWASQEKSPWAEPYELDPGTGSDVVTFGSLRGKDAWMGRKVFVAIGDHFENKEANALEAEYFGTDVGDLWAGKVAVEKEQAFGRAREPQSRGPSGQPLPPALMLCYGKILPNRWEGRCVLRQWHGDVRAPAAVARLRELQRLKAEGKTQRAVAAALGVTERTVKRLWYS